MVGSRRCWPLTANCCGSAKPPSPTRLTTRRNRPSGSWHWHPDLLSTASGGAAVYIAQLPVEVAVWSRSGTHLDSTHERLESLTGGGLTLQGIGRRWASLTGGSARDWLLAEACQSALGHHPGTVFITADGQQPVTLPLCWRRTAAGDCSAATRVGYGCGGSDAVGLHLQVACPPIVGRGQATWS